MHSMFIAGALAGLAGALQMTGVMPHRISMLAAQEGYGFDGISVALIDQSVGEHRVQRTPHQGDLCLG